MPRYREMTGQTFTRLLVLGISQAHRRMPRTRWICLCRCGRVISAAGHELRRQGVQSCGCLTFKHGNARKRHHTTEYRIWCKMLNRCLCPTSDSYHNYGGRGITVCQRWRESFQAFLQDVGARPTLHHTLDRINNDGHYELNNVQWATRKAQQRNRRDSLFLTLNDETRPLAEWADILGVNPHSLRCRRYMGWDDRRILTTPIHPRNRRTHKKAT
jgi:hypothetical protein